MNYKLSWEYFWDSESLINRKQSALYRNLYLLYAQPLPQLTETPEERGTIMVVVFLLLCCIHVILLRAELQASRSRFGRNVHVILQDLIPSLRYRTFLTATYLQLGAKNYRSTNRSLVNGCSTKPQSLAICIISLLWFDRSAGIVGTQHYTCAFPVTSQCLWPT